MVRFFLSVASGASCLAAGLAACAPVDQPRAPAVEIRASAETVRVDGEGDAADDPAVWIAPDPSRSLILGTDKTAGLYAYELDGTIAAFLPVGRLNNVDLRYDFAMPGPRRDIALATDRTHIALAVFMIDPETREVESWPSIPLVETVEPYGFCLYQSAEDGGLYGFVTERDSGRVIQLLIRYDREGRLSGDIVRELNFSSTVEGCVADDRTAQAYFAEEEVGIWTVGAEPGDGVEPVRLAAIDNATLFADVEGLALIPDGESGGMLVASAQSDDAFVGYDLEDFSLIGRVRIMAGDVDAVTHTDGIEISPAALGEAYPNGVFITQDDADDEGGQNFKLIDLDLLRAGLAEPIPAAQ